LASDIPPQSTNISVLVTPETFIRGGKYTTGWSYLVSPAPSGDQSEKKPENTVQFLTHPRCTNVCRWILPCWKTRICWPI
jgi:hypothetical protein